ncbi:arsenate reductase (glutaredoxin) [Corynebacterium sp. TAE3-ERU30]|uniref:arsenate reductase (glutaredoxin) n=1 Tax=Corynebacterium sp. TAE3-ERU30 TaxID=2849496 RepID=UPI001C4897AF|nr:arsenate reductase (glutaredoxin) [Corynebacterium sp. TAE3-ERU30]MBV7281587.1 arsenate reductase (glutaredoxin) [Corynebacterium sp. TAE3-ERU30]
MTLIYHNPRCSKSRAALQYLRDRGIEPTIVRYLEDTPDEQTLRSLLADAGLRPHEAIRTSESEYAELGLSSETPEEELIAAMLAHPRLIERPFVRSASGVVIARPTEKLDEIIDPA